MKQYCAGCGFEHITSFLLKRYNYIQHKDGSKYCYVCYCDKMKRLENANLS